MSDIDIIRLLNIIKGIATPKKSNNMIFGEITSIDPIKVKINNNLELSGKSLYLGQMCRPHKITMPHTHLINALMTEGSKGIITTQIISGVATDVAQTGSYDIKTQNIVRNDIKGTNERTLITSPQTPDLGGASLGMSIDISGSPVAAPQGNAVVSTTDLSQFTVNDSKHTHIVPEHTTQDVHFPGTDYEDTVEIEIYPRLKIGDIVLMFAMNDNQTYYIAERVEEA